MFKEGNILYFEPFYFENGNTPKPKYFLVLKEVDNQLILASLPTSHDHIPSNMSKVHGCIDDSTINFNCYYFKAGKDIAFYDVGGETFSFPRDTYVYGYRIAFFDLELFKKQIKEHLSMVTLKGRLFETEMQELLDCLRKSASVKRSFRKLL